MPPSDPTIPLHDTLAVIRDHIADAATFDAISKDLLRVQRELAAEKEAEKEASDGPKNKYRFVVLIRGDNALKAAVAGGAFIMAVPDSEDLIETYSGDGLIQRLNKAVHTQNEAPRGKRGKARSKIKSYPEAFRMLKTKAIKGSSSEFKVKTKDPVEVLVLTESEVPAPSGTKEGEKNRE